LSPGTVLEAHQCIVRGSPMCKSPFWSKSEETKYKTSSSAH